MKRLVVATGNRDKFREIAAILAGCGWALESLADHPHLPGVEETGETLRENALLKARAAARALGVAAVSDDSGLEVEALGGAPGVRSSRFAGENVTYADNNRLLLERMRGVPPASRGARFACVAALVIPRAPVDAGGSAAGPFEEVVVEGEVRGVITESLRGTHGFGYDPVFFVPELGMTFAEAGLDAKQRISHRARAFSAMREELETRSRGSER